MTDPQYFGTGLGIAVRPDNKALLEKLNAALKAIKADGTYQKISNQWFPEFCRVALRLPGHRSSTLAG